MTQEVEKFATVTWTAADVQTLAPSLSDEKAADWLHDNQTHIQNRLIELGWDVIETLLTTDGISLTEPE